MGMAARSAGVVLAVWMTCGTVGAAEARPLLDGPMRLSDNVSLLGDLDGDGAPEIAIGTPGDDTAGSDRGAIWIVFTDHELRLTLWRKLASEGDLLEDGDGFGMRLTAIRCDGNAARLIVETATLDDRDDIRAFDVTLGTDGAMLGYEECGIARKVAADDRRANWGLRRWRHELCEDVARAIDDLAQTLTQDGRHAEAVEVSRAALGVAPTATCLRTFAIAAAHAHDRAALRSAAAIALELDGDPRRLVNVVSALEADGRRAEGLAVARLGLDDPRLKQDKALRESVTRLVGAAGARRVVSE